MVLRHLGRIPELSSSAHIFGVVAVCLHTLADVSSRLRWLDEEIGAALDDKVYLDAGTTTDHGEGISITVPDDWKGRTLRVAPSNAEELAASERVRDSILRRCCMSAVERFAVPAACQPERHQILGDVGDEKQRNGHARLLLCDDARLHRRMHGAEIVERARFGDGDRGALALRQLAGVE